jgi:NAD+ kinase
MTTPVRTCGLVGRFVDQRVAESALALIPHLRARGVAVLLAADAELDVPADHVKRVPEQRIGDEAQLVIAIGGDGTLLYAARLVADRGIPLIGINRGRLGFLTDVLPRDMLSSVDAALEGRCDRDERPLLEARLISANGPAGKGKESRLLALNDVVLQKWETGRMLDFETWIDNVYVNTHGGDGLVVASSTGSTAYALSCGGPIVAPHLDVLVVAPICPHTLSDRPIVVSARSVVAVTMVDRLDAQAQITCDGAVLGEFRPGDRLEIHPTKHKITLLHPAGFEYYRLLRSKLHWGRGGYDRAAPDTEEE